MNRNGFSSKYKFLVCIALIVMIGAFFTLPSFAVEEIDIPDINLNVEFEEGGFKIADSIMIIIMITVLSVLPSILLMMTTFTRFIIVLGFIRRAIALQSTPPNQVLIGLALFMTIFIMAPVFGQIYQEAYQPLAAGEIELEVAIERGTGPIKEFMLRQVRSKDLALFLNLAGETDIGDTKDIPMRALVPAFILSELKLGFEIGFLLFLPFIVIDMVVASTLMALGMMMLPPVMISLPIKVLLFVLVDGWSLIVDKLILTVR